VCVAAIVTLALGACGSDGPVANLRPTTTLAGGVAPTPTEAPAAPDPPSEPTTPVATEAPVVTEPAPTPDPTTPAIPEPDPAVPTDDDGSDWLLPVLVIGGVLVAAVVVIAAIARSRKSEPDTATSAPTPQSSLLSTSQWINDHLTLELMAAAPPAALQRWATERSRLDNVAIGANQQYLEAGDPNWQPLAQTMSSLASAIDTNLALRAQDPPNAQLIAESTTVVNGHRTNLQTLIALLRPTLDR
jgi:hypothetical protein